MMSQLPDTVTTALNAVLRSCADGERAYTDAASALESHEAMLSQALACYGAERRIFQHRLSGFVERLGGERVRGDLLGATLQRGWTDLRQTIGAVDSGILLATCIRSDESMLTAYGHALAENIPPHLRRILAEQKRRTETSQSHLQGLMESSSLDSA